MLARVGPDFYQSATALEKPGSCSFGSSLLGHRGVSTISSFGRYKRSNQIIFCSYRYRTNGGPGCSSLEGLLQENGPFSWSWGTAKPVPNEFSWTNLSSVLWVEQPVGTGFSRGTPDIRVRILLILDDDSLRMWFRTKMT